ncbi:MAG: hypothetical protein PUE49_03290 [Eggerthellales bacterium]|nr:hypothetical protein [Eggerthellales bacterium]
MEIRDVKALISLMDEGNLTSIRVVEGNTEIELHRDPQPAPTAPAAQAAPAERDQSLFGN